MKKKYQRHYWLLLSVQATNIWNLFISLEDVAETKSFFYFKHDKIPKLLNLFIDHTNKPSYLGDFAITFHYDLLIPVVCKWGIPAHFQNGSKFFKVSPGNPLFILMTSLSVSLTPLPVASRNLITLPGISAHFKNGSKCRWGITRQTFQNIPEHF